MLANGNSLICLGILYVASKLLWHYSEAHVWLNMASWGQGRSRVTLPSGFVGLRLVCYVVTPLSHVVIAGALWIQSLDIYSELGSFLKHFLTGLVLLLTAWEQQELWLGPDSGTNRLTFRCLVLSTDRACILALLNVIWVFFIIHFHVRVGVTFTELWTLHCWIKWVIFNFKVVLCLTVWACLVVGVVGGGRWLGVVACGAFLV